MALDTTLVLDTEELTRILLPNAAYRALRLPYSPVRRSPFSAMDLEAMQLSTPDTHLTCKSLLRCWLSQRLLRIGDEAPK